MKIAFTSCMSTAAYAKSQPVWATVAAQKPDVLVLLGDSVYIDCPPQPDGFGHGHPSDNAYNDNDFATHLHSLYQRQLNVPEFKALIGRENLQTYAIWDDHDFLWNDADSRNARSKSHGNQAIVSGNLLRCWRTALAAGGAGFPATTSDAAIWRNFAEPFDVAKYDSAMPGYSHVELAPDIHLHLTDGRSWRNRDQLLGKTQRTQIEAQLKNAPDAVHIIASGSTFRRTGRSGWQDCATDRDWLLSMASQYRILMISGDVHRNEFLQPIACGADGRLFFEVTASGAAVNFNPFHWDDTDPGNSSLNYSQKFGLLDFHDDLVNVRLFDHGQASREDETKSNSPISIGTWKRDLHFDDTYFTEKTMSTYHLGTRSLAELEGVHADLVKVVKRAIEITPIDFAVTDGKRTMEEQRAYVASGASQTMDSRHLTGHAIDLVAFIGNKGRWELDLLCKIALAMRCAALECKVPLRWGGNWDVLLTDTDSPPEDMVQDYIQKRIAAGRKPFVDAPHFELPKSEYSAG